MVQSILKSSIIDEEISYLEVHLQTQFHQPPAHDLQSVEIGRAELPLQTEHVAGVEQVRHVQAAAEAEVLHAERAAEPDVNLL